MGAPEVATVVAAGVDEVGLSLVSDAVATGSVRLSAPDLRAATAPAAPATARTATHTAASALLRDLMPEAEWRLMRGSAACQAPAQRQAE